MDTKSTQKQLIGLITQHLSESIPVTRILTYKPSRNGQVTGKFESLGKVFNFSFNGDDARYKPAMNADSALFSEYYLGRFDAAPKTIKGTRALPKCTSKSYSCKGNVGVRCLPLTQSCKMGTDAIGRERLGKIKNLSSELADASMFDIESDPSSQKNLSKLQKSQADIVEKRMALAIEKKTARSQTKVTKPNAVTPKPIPSKKEPPIETPKKIKPKASLTKTPKPDPIKPKEEPVKPLQSQSEKVESNESTLEKLPQGKRNDFAESWKGAWNKAPKDLQVILDAVDQPPKVDAPTSPTDVNAYCRKGVGIFIGGAYQKDQGRANGTWRHEYGHWIDEQVNKLNVKSKAKEFNKFIDKLSDGKYKDEEEFLSALTLAKSPEDAAFKIRRKMSEEVQNGSDSYLSEIKEKIVGTNTSYKSCSKEGNKAFKDDETILLDSHKEQVKKFENLYDTEYSKYKNDIGVPAGFTLSKYELGLRIAKVKVGQEIALEASKNMEKNKSIFQEEKYNSLKNRLEKSLAGRLLLSGHESPESFFKNINQKDMLEAIVNPNSPVTIANALEKTLKDSEGLAGDLIGSITTNKVGRGHSDDYYAKMGNREGQNVEAFANLISIYGSGHPLAVEALKALSPNGFAFMKDTLKTSADKLKEKK